MDLTAIQRALYQHFATDGGVVALGAAVYDTLAPQNATYPYIVATLIDDTRQFNSDADIEVLRVQIDVYDAQAGEYGITGSAARAHDVMAAVESAMRTRLILSAAYRDVRAVPQSTRKILEDGAVWRLSTDYLMFFEPR